MNWDTIEGHWDELKGEVKGRWSALSDADIAAVSAKREKLIGKIQVRYGLLKDDATRQVDRWMACIGPDPS